MFRELLRKKQALSKEECISVLKTETRGVLSLQGDDGYPYGVPINFYYADNGHIYFHGSRIGHKIDSIKRSDKVSFCVYDKGYKNEGDWAYNVKSVIIFGRIRPVENKDEFPALLRGICHKFTNDEAYIEKEITKYTPTVQLLELIPEHMSGKLVNES